MCDMLMSITDAALLKQIEEDCTAVSAAMLSIPLMIPGTSYYKGIKVSLSYLLAISIQFYRILFTSIQEKFITFVILNLNLNLASRHVID